MIDPATLRLAAVVASSEDAIITETLDGTIETGTVASVCSATRAEPSATHRLDRAARVRAARHASGAARAGRHSKRSV